MLVHSGIKDSEQKVLYQGNLSFLLTLIYLYTVKKVIGNRLFRLKSASLLMKITISIEGIFLATHGMLIYIIDSKKNIPTKPKGENPLISDGKRCLSSLMEKADNLLENFDAEVKYSQHKVPPPPSERASVALLLVICG